MDERTYQRRLIKKIRELMPDCVVLKNDPEYMQGVPDLIVLLGDRWAMLEVKRSASAQHQPNQQFWVDQFGCMSFAAFIYPENERAVLYDLQRSLEAERSSRLSKR